MKNLYRWLRYLPLVYLAITISSLIYALVGGNLAGFYFALLTSPWSALSVQLFDAISPSLLDHGAGIVAFILGMLLNAWILHWILRRFLRPTG